MDSWHGWWVGVSCRGSNRDEGRRVGGCGGQQPEICIAFLPLVVIIVLLLLMTVVFISNEESCGAGFSRNCGV